MGGHPGTLPPTRARIPWSSALSTKVLPMSDLLLSLENRVDAAAWETLATRLETSPDALKQAITAAYRDLPQQPGVPRNPNPSSRRVRRTARGPRTSI